MWESGATPTQRIDEVLAAKRISKKKLADMLDISPTTLNSWINRGSDFPASYVLPISNALGVHPLWLLTGSEDVAPLLDDSYAKLDEDEQFLLDTFRALDREGKIVVSNKAVEEKRRVSYEKGNAETETDALA